MAFGMLSGPGAFAFARCFLHRSYVSLEKYLYIGVSGLPLFSSMNPSRSCQGYCLTTHVQWVSCVF